MGADYISVVFDGGRRRTDWLTDVPTYNWGLFYKLRLAKPALTQASGHVLTSKKEAEVLLVIPGLN